MLDEVYLAQINNQGLCRGWRGDVCHWQDLSAFSSTGFSWCLCEAKFDVFAAEIAIEYVLCRQQCIQSSILTGSTLWQLFVLANLPLFNVDYMKTPKSKGYTT